VAVSSQGDSERVVVRRPRLLSFAPKYEERIDPEFYRGELGLEGVHPRVSGQPQTAPCAHIEPTPPTYARRRAI